MITPFRCGLPPHWQLAPLCLLALAGLSATGTADEEHPNRVLWTTSRVTGAPEPPPPYTIEPAFTSISWERPIYAKSEPGSDHLFVIQLGPQNTNDTQIIRIQDDERATATESVLTVPGRVVYGIEFDPNYQENRQLFVFSNGPTGKPERLNRIERYTLTEGSPRRAIADSRLLILEWRSMGHDGGDLVFGQDEMLYATAGDGTTDSDVWLSAQDVSSLLGGVIRIDVRQASPGEPYTVPADNPFLNLETARPELFAFGLRNPWRMTADQQSGQIWIGNNGQDLWETAHLLERGANYGWSVYEGSHPFYLNRQRGPAAIVPPTIEHHHTEFRSLTGGVVYYGQPLAELEGTYIYGDYGTGKIWGARHDGKQLTDHRELADTTLQVAAFATSPSGQLLIVDHGTGLYRLKKNPITAYPTEFPRTLSETGLFDSTPDHTMAPGVLSYSINAPGWTDGAQLQRYLALPGDTQMTSRRSGGWDLPDGAVLVQTVSVNNGEARPLRVETRLLTRQNREWVGYSYLWNAEQDDARLVGSAGLDLQLSVVDSDGNKKPQAWRVPSRAECMSCHSRESNFLLSMTSLQLNRAVSIDGAAVNQLDHFEELGLMTAKVPTREREAPALVDPYDPSQDLTSRARSYLHVNCSGCHVRAGGGNARMELKFTKSTEEMRVISAYPQHTTFGIDQALLIKPQDPERSILYQRVSRRGRGQMPPLVSNVVDQQAVELIGEWIRRMQVERKFVQAWTSEDLAGSLAALEDREISDAGGEHFRKLGCQQCHRVANQGGGAGPDLTGIAKRLKPAELLESILLPSKKVAPEYASTILVTEDGRIVQGRIERETDTEIVLRTADSFAEPITVAKSEVEERQLTKQSIMPSGLLNSLEQEEILDLLAYLLGVES